MPPTQQELLGVSSNRANAQVIWTMADLAGS
jgi:hypothetical protein